MFREYANQQHHKGLLAEGDFIYFKDLKDKEGIGSDEIPVCDGTVSYVDESNIDIDNVNGDGDNITRRLDKIILCFDTSQETETETGGDNSGALAEEVHMTLHDRDAILEELWERFGDVPMDPETECIEEGFLGFLRGTHREEIWHWFDDRYSKGVHHLMYGSDGVDRTDQVAKLVYLQTICDECETMACAYNDGYGECRFSLVRGRKPNITEESGCVEGVIDPYWEEEFDKS